MSELWIVLQREFVERVRSKSFIASTLLTPLFLSLFVLVPALADREGTPPPPRVAVVDESGAGVGEGVERALDAPGGVPARLTVLERPMREVEDSLLFLLSADAGVDGVLWIPPDAVRMGTVSYRVRDGRAASLEGPLSLAVSGALVRERLRRVGVAPSLAADIFEPARVVTSLVGGPAGEEAEDGAGVLFALMTGFALYFLILLYGVQVLQSVQEEKANRIAEVLVSSIRASHLMLGKVLGVGLAALLQVTVWTALGLLVWSRRERLSELLGEPEMLGALAAPAPPATAAMLAFAVLGFFLYASLFAAAGAAAASSEDAQRFTMPLVAPLLIPVFVAEPIVDTPEGALATTLGWFPLTSPIVMPMRIGAGAMEAAEVGGALLVLLLSVYAMGTLAGKIYRVGILSTGKRPTLRELARWARAR